MTIKELIKELSIYDENMKVSFYDKNKDLSYNFHKVGKLPYEHCKNEVFFIW